MPLTESILELKTEFESLAEALMGRLGEKTPLLDRVCGVIKEELDLRIPAELINAGQDTRLPSDARINILAILPAS